MLDRSQLDHLFTCSWVLVVQHTMETCKVTGLSSLTATCTGISYRRMPNTLNRLNHPFWESRTWGHICTLFAHLTAWSPQDPGDLHSITSQQGSHCHRSSSDSLAASAAPGHVKMGGRFREFHPDLCFLGQKNVFSQCSAQKTITNHHQKQHRTSAKYVQTSSKNHASNGCISPLGTSTKKNAHKNSSSFSSSLPQGRDPGLHGFFRSAKDGRQKKMIISRWKSLNKHRKSWEKNIANHPTGGSTSWTGKHTCSILFNSLFCRVWTPPQFISPCSGMPLAQPSIVQRWGMPDAALLQAAFNHWTATYSYSWINSSGINM